MNKSLAMLIPGGGLLQVMWRICFIGGPLPYDDY